MQKESYIKEEFINEYGLKTIVMGIRDVGPVVAAARLKELKSQAEEINDDGSFWIEDESECGICLGCKEWSSIIRHYDAEGGEEEALSGCCGDGIHVD